MGMTVWMGVGYAAMRVSVCVYQVGSQQQVEFAENISRCA